MAEILIILLLIFISGIFSMAEMALVSAKKYMLSADARKGNKSARLAFELASDPDSFLPTIQIGITLVSILTGIFSGKQLKADLAEIFVQWGLSDDFSPMLSQLIIVVIVTYLSILLGELVPKRIGIAIAERTAKAMAYPTRWVAIAATPLVWLLSKNTDLFLKIFGIEDSNTHITEEEIKSIVQEGADEGEVQPVEKKIVNRVFLMGDLNISSIMTHKNDIVSLGGDMSAADIRAVLNKHLYEFYPVVANDLDHIRGIVRLKDLVLHIDDERFELSSILREPTFFPENMDVYKALEEMKRQRTSRVLVCDEFGSCVGIVTLRDIMEGLVGNIGGDDEPQIVKRTGGDGWLVDAQCQLYDFLEYFDRSDLFQTTDYHTVGGLILQQLQHIPACGERFGWQCFDFEIADMDSARIDKVIVTLNRKTDADDAQKV